MLVQKFGGSSVATPANMLRVANIVKDSLKKNDRLIVVLSALGGITNQLIEAGNIAVSGNEKYITILENLTTRHVQFTREAIPAHRQSAIMTRIRELCNEIEDICKGVFLVRELTPHSIDRISSYGELLSTAIFSEMLGSMEIPNTWYDATKIIKTNNDFGKAAVNMEATLINLDTILSSEKNKCIIMPGFIGSDEEGNTTTLGRGGSDYTASVLGALCKASAIEIWTDVSGIMTADPGLVRNSKIIREISYEEALELSHFGAKVIFPKTITPALQCQTPVIVKNTFAPEEKGTAIIHNPRVNGNPIRGISCLRNISLLTLEGGGMIGMPGFSKRLFETLANEKINVILITQSSSEFSICVAVETTFSEHARKTIDSAFSFEISTGKLNPILVENQLSIVALVGDSMKSRAGMSGKMFSALGRNGINVRAIAQGSSERNISAVILEKDVKKATNVLHEEFFENTHKQVNLYICGTGNVGKKLLDQLSQQQQHLKDKLLINLRVVGIGNSRKQHFSDEGISLSNWETLLNDGETMSIEKFVATACNENKRNSIFVDVTASQNVATQYPALLKNSIAVVACNKIACSSESKYYHQLKSEATKRNTSFFFETNVGAGLPVLATLSDLLRSGDEVIKIEAVLSGTLNYIFNHYDGSCTFADVVRAAAREGYTEPDPRLDLSGIDVMRKILILARESGYEMELSDISNNSFVPEDCMKEEGEKFYHQLEQHEKHFLDLIAKAKEKGKKLKYVARLENGKAATGLLEIDKEHDIYHLYGKDNIVAFYTKRYPEQPLVIKGAGAGAEVTASGVFADILRVARS